jgi:thiol-disulfide isomerase/thioredoxin
VLVGSYDVPFEEPEVTTESPRGAAELAQKLKDGGAKMYGAFWCTHCFEQKEIFGREAQVALPYVECYPDGYKGPASIAKVCVDADIQGFPTWIIRGQKVEGDWPLMYLNEVADGGDPKTLAKKYP